MADVKTKVELCQISIVVKDLQATIEHYASLGFGPFKVYSVDTRDMTGVIYKGEPADYAVIVASGKFGPLDLEVIQPTRGKNSYTEFMDKCGQGLHHIALRADDYDAACAEIEKGGFKHLQGGPIEGVNRTGRFDYFDTVSGYGSVFEVLDMPEDIGEPDYIYPPQPE